MLSRSLRQRLRLATPPPAARLTRAFSALPPHSAFLFAKEAGKDDPAEQKFDKNGKPIAPKDELKEKDAEALPLPLDLGEFLDRKSVV